jgi:uncharacterized protein YoxC
MAEEKEDIILEFKIDQKDVFTELEKTKKAIIQIKQEQKELNTAYKKGAITIDEFVQEGTRLEANLKRQQSSYNNVQKSVTGVKTQMDKLISSNQQISKDLKKTSQSFQDVAGNINIAGTNVGALTTRLASFANPATAAVGIASALGAAYARSTIGAKDLEFAQNQLSAAITITSNAFAGLISSSGDGEGIVSKALNAILFRLDPLTGTLSKLSALNQEKLEDLGRTEIEVRDKVNQRLEENQELLTEIQSDSTNFVEKMDMADAIVSNLRRSEEELKIVLEEELKILNQQLAIDSENEQIQTSILLKKKEISNVERDAEKRVQAIVRLQNNLNEAKQKELDITAAAQNAVSRNRAAGDTSLEFSKTGSDFLSESGANSELNSAENLNAGLKKLSDDRLAYEKNNIDLELQYKEAANMAKLQGAATVAEALSQLADEGSEAQKGLALTAIAADTAAAVTGGIKAAQSVPFPGNIAAMAATIAAILGNIAQAKSIAGFAEGGWTGPGSKYQAVGIVHADEYVTPKHIVHSSAAQPHLRALENMRLRGYADGGLVTNSLTSEVNQQLQLANIMKNMPPVELSVKEVTRAQKRVSVRERATKIKNNAS